MKRQIRIKISALLLIVSLFVGLNLFVFESSVYADVPHVINYQGKITKSIGALVDTTIQMVFSIYDVSTNGIPLWTETQPAVEVEKGVFSVLLGSMNPLPESIFDGTVLYLGLKIGADPEITPRKEMVSVAYAMKSIKADTANFAHASGTTEDIDWTFQVTDTADTTLVTGGQWGIARAGNRIYGNADSTHVSFGSYSYSGESSEDDKYCTVGGGYACGAYGWGATVKGGWANVAVDSATALGGRSHDVWGTGATVIGGSSNRPTGSWATIGGGGYSMYSEATGVYATIGGGRSHIATDSSATVLGGIANEADNKYATVGGGYINRVSKKYGTVAGGMDNDAWGDGAFVGGGYWNGAHALYSAVGGGEFNFALSNYATIAGGSNSDATAYWSTVGGGRSNQARAWYATVPGGYVDTAAGLCSFASGELVTVSSDADYSFAYGRSFRTITPGAVVFYDRTTGDEIKVGIDTTSPGNILTVRKDSPTDPIADAWTTYSSIRWKENIVPIDNALDKVLVLRGVYFDWKGNGKHDIGMIAEEVGRVIPEVVSYEENGQDAQGLDYARLTAVIVEAIKEQQKQIEEVKGEIEEMKK